MSHTHFQVVYDGPALAGSTIDVRELAPALLAFGEVLEQANHTLNGGRAQVSLRVSASFKSGSFGIDFSVVQRLIDQALSLFKEPAVVSARQLADQLGFVYGKAAAVTVGVLGLIRWLRNRKISRVVLLEHDRVRVEVDGDAIETERRTIELLRNFKLRLALQQAIADPLAREGFDSVAIATDPAEGFVVIERAEREFFVAPVLVAETLADDVLPAKLQLVNVSFRDENKWRFFDGNTSFHAAIADVEFLGRVQAGDETFAAGDILDVQLRRRQLLDGESMRNDFEVVKVLGHRRRMAQLPIPFDDGGAVS